MSHTFYRCIAVDVQMPVVWDAEEYNMQHKRRGHAVIFNHDTFDTDKYAPREGSQVDVKNLHKAFSSLLFDVNVHNNLEYSKIKEVISARM
jgi:caspase-like apoptosis-related cysteine protease